QKKDKKDSLAHRRNSLAELDPAPQIIATDTTQASARF
ncbi:unnamed protein product, partial [marine sediment metagenome]